MDSVISGRIWSAGLLSLVILVAAFGPTPSRSSTTQRLTEATPVADAFALTHTTTTQVVTPERLAEISSEFPTPSTDAASPLSAAEDTRLRSVPTGGASLVSNDGATLPDIPPANDAVHRVIDQELPAASAEERQIWYDELGRLPASVVQDLLRLRKSMQGPSLGAIAVAEPIVPVPPQGPNSLVAVDPHAAPLPPLARIPADAANIKPPAPRLPRSAHAYWHIIDAYNEANENSLGFRRLIVEFAGGRAPDWADFNPHAYDALDDFKEVAYLRIDASQGAIRETGRRLDVAINGRGWFRVEHSSGLLATRVGVLTVLADGRLGVTCAGRSAPLVPAIAIPKDVPIKIESDGWVMEHREETPASEDADAKGREELRRFGQIQLVDWDDSSSLAEAGGGFYRETAECGAMSGGAPRTHEFGSLMSGSLELSNLPRRGESR